MSKLLETIETIEDLFKQLPDTAERLGPLLEFFYDSETQMLDLIKAAIAGESHVAPPPETRGDLEFGLVRYWLTHPTEEHEAVLAADQALSITMQALQYLIRDDPSRIDPNLFKEFSGIAYNWGFVAVDGTLYTPGKFAQIDPLWLTAAINYAINRLDPDSVLQPFPTGPYHKTVAQDRESITVAIIGDWGCGVFDSAYDGQGPAVAVMDAVRDLKPDYVVHLGDVYYCGTDARHPEHEEQTNFLDVWNTGTGAETCFTLNSNHEMYGAAKGLIEVALAPATPFEQQNQTTYFALEYGKWVILGLDSAYFDPSHLYMKGAIGNAANTQQRDFVGSLGDLEGRKVLTLTHHNPMSFDGKKLISNAQAGQTLWDGMTATLGDRQPDVWYWGHLHLGVAYNNNSVLGKGDHTLCRCVGHSAIPYGNAHGMDTNNVDYYAHAPLDLGTKQVQNGFAMLTLFGDGAMDEAFYEVDKNGNNSVAWQKSTPTA